MRRVITVAALVAAFFVPTVASPQAPSSTNQGGWQQIHGTVHNVSGSTFTLDTDDGRRLNVNMAKISPEIQKSVQNRDRVTVAAYQISGNNVRAEFIQKDSSAGAAPSASPPNTAVDQNNWKQIHGTVHNVSGSTFTLDTDDGRRLNVNMSKVSPEIQKSVQNRDQVTVAAYQISGNNVNAEFIQKDSSASK